MTKSDDTQAWLVFEDGKRGPFVIAAKEIEACVKLAQQLHRLPPDQTREQRNVRN